MLQNVVSVLVTLVVLSSCRNESLFSEQPDDSIPDKQLLPFGTAVAVANVSEIGEIPNPNSPGGSDGGSIGVPGPMGPAGPQGPMGPQGAMGPMGPQGPQGIAGLQGPAGLAGAKGDKGDKGEAGAAGSDGKAGRDGSDGVDGKNGNAILAGFYNPLDSQGKDDDLYFDQENGDMYKKVSGAWSFVTSLMGEKGDAGEQGIQGEQGVQGLHGMDGEKGDSGERGERGLMGYTGATGAQGERGYGAGIVSRPATSCPEEANGGTQFTTFVDKNNDGQLSYDDTVTSISVVCGGLAGRDGRAGESSRLTVVLASNSQCPAGGYVYTVQNGSESQSYPVCNGTQGLQGLQGVAGAPGSSVTPIKFCASDNTRFPEYGLLIGNDLFAVYWGTQPYSPYANTAFLAKVVPGSYRSTGGNGCYFNVDANNRISY